jgi:acyl carrier protein
MMKTYATPEEVLARIEARRSPRPALDTVYAGPRDSVEQTVVGVWTDVLGVDEVGIDDNFFALGGDSLHMTQIASRLRKCFSADLSFDDFFDSPTVAGLSNLLRVRWEEDGDEGTVADDHGFNGIHNENSGSSSVSCHQRLPASLKKQIVCGSPP